MDAVVLGSGPGLLLALGLAVFNCVVASWNVTADYGVKKPVCSFPEECTDNITQAMSICHVGRDTSLRLRERLHRRKMRASGHILLERRSRPDGSDLLDRRHGGADRPGNMHMHVQSSLSEAPQEEQGRRNGNIGERFAYQTGGCPRDGHCMKVTEGTCGQVPHSTMSCSMGEGHRRAIAQIINADE
ncbi:unnamed protein product [Caretta caretta]